MVISNVIESFDDFVCCTIALPGGILRTISLLSEIFI